MLCVLYITHCSGHNGALPLTVDLVQSKPSLIPIQFRDRILDIENKILQFINYNYIVKPPTQPNITKVLLDTFYPCAEK